MTKSIYPRTARIARKYWEAGFAILPLRCDGSKATLIAWKKYQWWELEPYFLSQGDPSGIGILCGNYSMGLEVLDFDSGGSAYPRWANLVNSIIATMPIILTPSGGYHVYYRTDAPARNRQLAKDKQGAILIETRAQGGMVVAAGSPLEVHKLRKPYRLLQGNPLAIPLITDEQRKELWDAAMSLNEYEKPALAKPKRAYLPSSSFASRPGDRFNYLAEWADILEPKGWTIERTSGDVIYWRKPHGSQGNHHATTGYGDSDMFYCFSTDAAPFDAEQAYNKFAAYTLLYHAGDFQEAAKAIKSQSKQYEVS